MKLTQIPFYLKAVFELGADQVFYNLAYKLGLHSGYYRFSSLLKPTLKPCTVSFDRLPEPTNKTDILAVMGKNGFTTLLEEADIISDGEFRQFGDSVAPIQFDSGQQTLHWVDIELGKARSTIHPDDIKLTWEPSRFGWALVLGRAFFLTQKEEYPQRFWQKFDTFNKCNPVNFGPNWSSGQEVAIRLINTIWAASLFKNARSSQNRLEDLATTIEQHAFRISQTLAYARSQNNNHYLTECAALITASLVLPTHSLADRWYQEGWAGFRWCIKTQIDGEGEYVQHSTNYHRLMLQVCLWVFSIDPTKFDPGIVEPLAKASLWLANQLDETSGGVPNLGANDGAMLFALQCTSINDFRPCTQAALNVFTNDTLPFGSWNEMLLWYGSKTKPNNSPFLKHSNGLLLSDHGWCSIRTKAYQNRPSHADHLHTEIWWTGQNIALDAGTYSYNSAYPWDNSLTTTKVHNTVFVDGMDQMDRVGKFLYANWGRSKVQKQDTAEVVADTTAYNRIGVNHTRTSQMAEPSGWRLIDHLTPNATHKTHRYSLHWLLADLDWTIKHDQGLQLTSQSTLGEIALTITTSQAITAYSLVRRGEVIAGDLPCQPYEGWISPTYFTKAPAYSLTVTIETTGSCDFTSLFSFPVV